MSPINDGEPKSDEVKTVQKEQTGDDTEKETFRATGWDLLMKGMDKIKKILVVLAAIIFSIASYEFVGWYSTVAFWLSFPIYYIVFRYVIKVPVVALIEYDHKTKSGDIWAIPRSMWSDLKKEGVQAHVSMGGRPIYIAKSFNPNKMEIDFAWIHEETFLDFWMDDSAFGVLSEKLQELEEKYLKSITLKDVMAHEKAEEYINLGQNMEDELLKNGKLPEDVSDISAERPSKMKMRGSSDDS